MDEPTRLDFAPVDEPAPDEALTELVQPDVSPRPGSARRRRLALYVAACAAAHGHRHGHRAGADERAGDERGAQLDRAADDLKFVDERVGGGGRG